MSDGISEIKAALERLVEQTVLSMNASMGLESVAASQLRLDNPNAGQESGGDVVADQGFTTGYDGTNTVTPFMRGISGWGVDVWAG